ncbi:hypothetical protein ABE218_08525 [Bacillus smithii]|uniref:hypothetical protein n=1 Tax=Bacillus smithii TaxID=1479 RepID=UPI003D19FE94
MGKYRVDYYFGKDFYVTRIIEDVSKEEALKNLKKEKVAQFEDDRGVLCEFDMKDVKLIKISTYTNARAIPKPF